MIYSNAHNISFHSFSYLIFTVPSKPPQNVKAPTKQSSSWIPVTWEQIPIDFVHGILLGYEIRFSRDDKTKRTRRSIAHEKLVLGPNVTEANLTLLESASTYQIEISGFTVKGYGQWTTVTAG